MKIQRLLISVALTAGLFGGLYFFGSSHISPLYTLHTSIMLPADIVRSWRVLTDFEHYPDWNPYLRRVEGTLAVGETLSFTLVDKNFKEPLDLVATVGEISPRKRFFWIGKVGIQGIFDTKHVFELVSRGEDSTELHHYEEFRGLIPAILPQRNSRSQNTLAAFAEMNKALSQRIEEGEK